MTEGRVVWRLHDDGVAVVELNRPERRNAVDGLMFAAIAAAGTEVRHARGVRAVVLTGRGVAFCAGLDLAGLAATAEEERTGSHDAIDPLELQPDGLTHLGQQCAWTWRQVPVPVIAAINGAAIGAGLQIALGADIRIAHPDTKFSLREVRFGITPDMTGTFTLSRLARPDVAMLLAATGMTVDGRRAQTLGLVTELSDDPLSAALDLARTIAGQSPDAVRGVKRLLYAGDETAAHDRFALEREIVQSVVGSPNQVEAVNASFEGRPPSFTDA